MTPEAIESTDDEAEAAESDMDRLARLLWPLANAKRLDLLAFLTRPHYLEEIASHLGLTRQAARKHVEMLLSIDVIQRRPAVRGSGAVVEYAVNPRALFLIWQEFEKLGALRPAGEENLVAHTRVGEGDGAVPGDGNPETGPPVGPTLWAVHGLNTGTRYPLTHHHKATWRLGREPRCDIRIDYDPFVSIRHAEVNAQNGHFVLTDLASRNGTQHNGTLLPRGGEAVLRHGDLVGVGRTTFLFWEKRPDGP